MSRSSPRRVSGTGAEFECGTVMFFRQAAAPLFWTKDVAEILDNSALRIVTSTRWADGKKGTAAFDSVFGVGKLSANYTPGAAFDYLTAGEQLMVNVGSGSHNHALALDLNYVNIIIASKD